jgi:galactokinase
MSGNIAKIRDLFEKKFGTGEPITIGRAPGRVNLIGEHTDYNDGYVFPMAIDFQMVMAARLRTDRLVIIHSGDYDQQVEFSLDKPVEFDSQRHWSNYPRGVFSIFQKSGIRLQGVDMAFMGNIPQGAGLSSSAALEVVTTIILQKLNDVKKTPSELALLCQRAENRFVGMNCGIMDQFISIMGRQNCALFLDCRSLEYQQVPLELGNNRVLICQSGVKHSLVESEYNKRRQECEQGVAILSKRFPGIKALRDATIEQLDACKPELNEVVYRRCRHVITENDRVLESIRVLKQGDLESFGRLMDASHNSLRDLYEVSCPEIDRLVDLARKVPGVLGSRITGGGFGGCTVNLVDSNSIAGFSRLVVDSYLKETGIEAKVYVSMAAAGASIVESSEF